MYTGDYTCLEIFALSKKGENGIICLTDMDGNVQQKKAGTSYYAWLKFNLKKNTEYKIETILATVTLAYLSGSDAIMEKGVKFIEIEEGIEIEKEFEQQYNTCYREQYHFNPWKNWINDPNGLCWYQGRYHMFYQMNPHGQEWSNMYWGHTVSKDLVHWIHLPLVLEPQSEILKEPAHLKGGAFSGCAAVLENKVIFYFTRHYGLLEDGEDTIEEQWMMESTDMLHFTSEKQIISKRPEGASFDFRDPKVTKIQDRWYMVLGSALNGKAAMLLYTSKDTKYWEYKHPLLVEKTSGIRCFECPDFFELEGSYVAIGAWMSYYDEQKRFQMSRYYIGSFKEETWKEESRGWFDFGSNCYAMQSFEHNGRRISIGWISDFYGEHIKVKDGAYGSMTIPRELHIKEKRLYMKPIEEIYSLKEDLLYHSKKPASLMQIQGNTYYAKVIFLKNTPFSILLGKEGEKEIYFVNNEKGIRIQTYGVKSEGIYFKAEVKEVKEAEFFIDRRVVEIYINQGEAVGTKLFYNSANTGCFKMEVEEEEAVAQVEVFTMKSIWKEER